MATETAWEVGKHWLACLLLFACGAECDSLGVFETGGGNDHCKVGDSNRGMQRYSSNRKLWIMANFGASGESSWCVNTYENNS